MENVFEQYPNLEEYYETSDGQKHTPELWRIRK